MHFPHRLGEEENLLGCACVGAHKCVCVPQSASTCNREREEDMVSDLEFIVQSLPVAFGSLVLLQK